MWKSCSKYVIITKEGIKDKRNKRGRTGQKLVWGRIMRKERKTINWLFSFWWLKLLLYSWLKKKIFRRTLVNDCHSSYCEICHVGLGGLLCCRPLINLQTSNCHHRTQIHFPYVEWCFLKTFPGQYNFCLAKLALSEY